MKTSGDTKAQSWTTSGRMPLKVISRDMWGAVAPRCREKQTDSAERVVIHHTALWSCATPRECYSQVQHIQRLHMQDRDFDDIGYNFLVGGDGSVYEGRGWGIVGAHTKGNNHNSIGIAFIGNFNNEAPSSVALCTTRELLQCGLLLGYIHPEFTLVGHRDLGVTECPGALLYKELKHLSQY